MKPQSLPVMGRPRLAAAPSSPPAQARIRKRAPLLLVVAVSVLLAACDMSPQATLPRERSPNESPPLQFLTPEDERRSFGPRTDEPVAFDWAGERWRIPRTYIDSLGKTQLLGVSLCVVPGKPIEIRAPIDPESSRAELHLQYAQTWSPVSQGLAKLEEDVRKGNQIESTDVDGRNLRVYSNRQGSNHIVVVPVPNSANGPLMFMCGPTMPISGLQLIRGLATPLPDMVPPDCQHKIRISPHVAGRFIFDARLAHRIEEISAKIVDFTQSLKVPQGK